MRYYKVDELISSLPLIAEKLRSRGFRVGVSEVVELARLARAYADLNSRDALSEDEVAAIAYAVIKEPGGDRAFLEELRGVTASRRVSEAAERIEAEISEKLRILGVSPGWRVSKKKAGRRGKEALAAYLQLRRIGVITGRPGNERVADPSAIKAISLRLAMRGFESLEEAYRELRPMRGRDYALMEAEAGLHPGLGGLDERRLVELGWAAARKGNSQLLRSVARELARRVEAGRVSRLEDAFKLLRASGMLDSRLASEMIAGDPGLVEEARGLPPREFARIVARAAEMAGVERAGEIVAKALRSSGPGEAVEILSKVPLESLWAVKKHPLRGAEALALEAAAAAARSLVSAIRYLETGNEGWRDMALEESERAARLAARAKSEGAKIPDPSRTEALARLAATIAGGSEHIGESVVDAIARRLGPSEAVRVLRAAYARAESEEARRLLAQSLEKLLSRLASREGLVLLPRWRLSPRRGRVDVRRSIYLMARQSPRPLVFREKERASRISLVLDVSGSMIDYSSWALAVSLLFARNVERVVVFSHRVRVVEGPLKPRELAEVLLSAEFKGLTNISAALREAGHSRSRRIVVVTDLKQTVDDEPVAAAVKRLVSSGRRVVFISPPTAPWEEVEAVERAGGRVTVAYTPRQAALRVLRMLLR